MSTKEDTRGIVVDWDRVATLCGFDANWVAMSKEGVWRAYEGEPSMVHEKGFWDGTPRSPGLNLYVRTPHHVIDWRDSLIQRPVTHTTAPTTDPVNHPSHYTQGPIETIVAIASVVAGYSGHAAYCAGNVVKYVARAPFKGSLVEDLRKAEWYLKALIREVEREQ